MEYGATASHRWLVTPLSSPHLVSVSSKITNSHSPLVLPHVYVCLFLFLSLSFLRHLSFSPVALYISLLSSLMGVGTGGGQEGLGPPNFLTPPWEYEVAQQLVVLYVTHCQLRIAVYIETNIHSSYTLWTARPNRLCMPTCNKQVWYHTMTFQVYVPSLKILMWLLKKLRALFISEFHIFLLNLYNLKE